MAGNIVRLIFGADTSDAERGMDRVGDAADGLTDRISGRGAAFAAAGVAVGGALMAGFASSLEADSAAAKLEAQMGAGSQAAKDAGEVAGKLYANAYGESMEEVGNAVRTVMQSGILMEDATNEQIESITGKVMSMADAFDQDLNGSINAVSQMVKTGLAPNAEVAMDILTRGLQEGGDKAGDLMDTFNEYGTQFRKLGFDGQTAMGLIQQGLQGGARDADLVADAFKEFSIRAIDGSSTTIDAYKSLGLNAEQMAQKIAAGGPTAAQGLDTVLDKLNAIKDPVEKNRIGVELFGTQWEDLGAAVNSLDVSKASEGLGTIDGAAQKVNDTLGETVESKLTSAQRGFDEWKNKLIGVQGPLGDIAASVFTFGGDALGMVGSLAMAGVAFQSFGGFARIAAAGQAALNLVMSMNPIALVVIAIAALVAGFIYLWNTSEGFRNFFIGLWENIKNIATTVATWIGDKVREISDWFSRLPGMISGAISNFVTMVSNGITNVVNFFAGLPGRIAGFIAGFVSNISNGVSQAVTWMAGLPGKILSAVGNLGSLLLSAGGDLLRGLWNGIVGAAGWLRQQIGNFFGSLLPGWAKDMLGIASPSKVFAKIGKEIPAGMAQGIEKNLTPLQKATQGMVDSIDVGEASGISLDQIKQLQAQGWYGRADDGAERLYRPTSNTSSGGQPTVTFQGNTDTAFATYVMKLIREGKIQIKGVFV